jgi:purine-binding chemotaxis protein CheW
VSETADLNQELLAFIENEDVNTMDGKYLTFIMGDEVYGMPIEYVFEIIGIQHITKVPDMESYIKGVINLRGQVIPVIDVRERFEMEHRDYDDRTCIMVTRVKGISIGLIVDTVEEVMNINNDTISPAPNVATAHSGKYIKGIAQCEDNLVIIILNLRKLLFDNVESGEDGEEEN